MLPPCDLAIIGAGPAGLSAAINAASEGLSVTMFEPASVGGSAQWSTSIENLAGFPAGITGRLLSERTWKQARKFGARMHSDCVRSFCPIGNGAITLQMHSGRLLDCRALIIACGLKPRALTIPGAERFGVFQGANPEELPRFRDKAVALIGGGNNAGQAAVAFLAVGAHVTLFSRSSLSESMSSYLISRLRGTTTIHESIDVPTIEGVPPKLTIHDQTFDAVFSFIGSAPSHSFPVQCDPSGYILTDASLETSLPGVFAIGDIRASNNAKRIASAVGDGASAVASVHSYLERLAK